MERKDISSIMSESYNLSYGIYHYSQVEGSPVTSISSPDWDKFYNAIQTIDNDQQLVVSPELITITGSVTLGSGNMVRELVSQRIEDIKQVTVKHPQTTVLLGTPVFNGIDKPTNSVIYIKNGEITGRVNKRTAATKWEKEHFTFIPEEAPTLIPNTSVGVLICSDLATSSIYLLPGSVEERDDILRMTGRESLLNKNPTFIHSQARSLVIPSCWGVGSMSHKMEGVDANEYYRLQLRNISARVLQDTPHIRHIVVTDRAPSPEGMSNEMISTKPINAILTSNII